MTRTLLFIVNPVAGRMQIKRHLEDVLQVFVQADYLPTVYITQCVGDATRFVREHAGSYDAIACSGGDGTLNEVVAGLQEGHWDKPLGYIPIGSTNVFADCIGLPTDPIAAAENIVSGTERRLDIATFNGLYFNYIAAIGVFSALSYNTSQTMKNAIGHAAYILNAIQDLSKTRPHHLRVVGSGYRLNQVSESEAPSFSQPVEGVLAEGDYLFAAISNCDTLANTFPLEKRLVALDDGMFEFLLIRYPKSALELQNVLAALTSQNYLHCDKIEFFRFQKCSIFTDGSEPWSLDGEMGVGAPPVEVEVHPNALRLMTAL